MFDELNAPKMLFLDIIYIYLFNRRGIHICVENSVYYNLIDNVFSVTVLFKSLL